ncbi:hypothetical protein RB195_003827 [Necator americanus]|uniref:Uncharacterized protein n=1 Tax=Necator americanus TaxID=51031 RepID=A0ABR1DQE8_NECAM
MPIPLKADILPTYEQTKDQAAPISELTATTLDEPPGYEQLEIPPRFTLSEPTSTPSPQRTCINCQENICYHSGSVCENEESPVKCAECKRREAEEMAECCMGILEVIWALVSMCKQ